MTFRPNPFPFGFLPAGQTQMYSRPPIPNGPRVSHSRSYGAYPTRFTVRREAFLTDLDHKLYVEELAAWLFEQAGHDPRYWSQYMDVFFVYDDDLGFAFRMRWT